MILFLPKLVSICLIRILRKGKGKLGPIVI